MADRRMHHPRRFGRVAAATAAGLTMALLAGCGSDADAGTDGELTAIVLDNPYPVDATALATTEGEPYSLVDSTDTRLTLVFYGYTNCPDICGQVMSTLAGTAARFDDDERDEFDVVFVTTDPARDTAEVVSDYVSQYDDSFIGVTGDLKDIITVADSMMVGVEAGEKLPSGGYDITHGTQVMAVDAGEEVPLFWKQDVSQAQLESDIRALLSED